MPAAWWPPRYWCQNELLSTLKSSVQSAHSGPEAPRGGPRHDKQHRQEDIHRKIHGVHRCKAKSLQLTQQITVELKQMIQKLQHQIVLIKTDLFWRDIALFLHPIVVHKDVCLCCRSSGAFHHIWQQLPDFWSRPDAKGPFTLLCSSTMWEWVCILCTVEPPRLFHTIGQEMNGRRVLILLVLTF